MMCAIISRRGSLGEFLAYMSLFDSEMSIACSGSVVRQTWSRVELVLSILGSKTSPIWPAWPLYCSNHLSLAERRWPHRTTLRLGGNRSSDAETWFPGLKTRRSRSMQKRGLLADIVPFLVRQGKETDKGPEIERKHKRHDPLHKPTTFKLPCPEQPCESTSQ